MTYGYATFPLSVLVEGLRLCMKSVVHSDGYLTGLGAGLWSSSKRFDQQREMIQTARGQVMFIDPSDGSMSWKNEDYMAEGVWDYVDCPVDEHGDPQEEAPMMNTGPFAGVSRRQLVGWVEGMVGSGPIPAEFADRLNQIPMRDRFSDQTQKMCGIVEWAGSIEEAERAIPAGDRSLVGNDAASLVASIVNEWGYDRHFWRCANYAWDGGRWVADVSMDKNRDDVARCWIPLSMALAMEATDQYVYGGVGSYFEAGLTPEDNADLLALGEGIGFDKMYAGVPSAQAYFKAMEEKLAMDGEIPSGGVELSQPDGGCAPSRQSSRLSALPAVTLLRLCNSSVHFECSSPVHWEMNHYDHESNERAHHPHPVTKRWSDKESQSGACQRNQKSNARKPKAGFIGNAFNWLQFFRHT